MSKELNQSNNNLRNYSLLNTLFPCFSSFVFARIFVEWNLLSRINWGTSFLYKNLWLSAGYIMSIFLLIWITYWEKFHYSLIQINIYNGKTIKGIKYSICLLYYLISVTISYSLLVFIAINLKSNYNKLTDLILLSLSNLIYEYKIIFIILILITLSLFITKISNIIKITSNILLIYIYGRLWIESLNDNTINNFSLLSINSRYEFYLIILITLIFIYLKITYIILRYHTTRNKLSDWKSTKIPKALYKNFIIYFVSIPIIFCFIIGIYY